MPDLFTSPPVVTIAATPFLTVDIGIPRFFGPFRRSGDIWAAGYIPHGPFIRRVGVVKSSDAGATWGFQDQSNTPALSESSGYIDFSFGANILHILGRSSFNPVYVPFDMASSTYGTSVTASFGAGFWKIAQYNGSPIAIFNLFSGGTGVGQPLQYSVIGGSFGSPIALQAGLATYTYVPVSTILDAVTGTLHILYQRFKNTSPSSQDLWYVALDSGGGVSTPVQIASRIAITWDTPIGAAQGAIWTDGSAVRHLLWAVRGPESPSVVTLYDGANPASPSWTTSALSIGSSLSGGESGNANVILSGGVPYIFWYRQAASGPDLSRVEYCTWDGSAFSAIATAWDVIANSVGGVTPSSLDIDAYSITANGAGWDLMADAYVNPNFDQSLVFLGAAGSPPVSRGPRNRFY